MLVDELPGLLSLADGVPDEQQIALPVDAVAGGDDGRGDLGELGVEVAEGVVGEDEIGLGGGEGFEVRRLAGSRVGHGGELRLVLREGVGEVVGDEPGVAGAGGGGGDEPEGEQVVELPGAEDGDTGGRGLESGGALEVRDGARELAVRADVGAHAGGEGGGGGGRPVGGAFGGPDDGVAGVGADRLGIVVGGRRATGQQPSGEDRDHEGLPLRRTHWFTPLLALQPLRHY